MVQAAGQSAVIALGNFDGVHRGHQALIAAAQDVAAPQGLPVVALTFAPHPRRFFAPNLPPFLLTDTAQKQERLLEAGASAVRVVPFDAALAAMPAQDFVQHVLLEQCQARGIVAGEDFRFGHRRAGDMGRMVEWAGTVPVLAVAPVRDGQGQRYATSTARALLQTGQVVAAAHILGRPWAVRGIVAHGDKRGRTIGFPTANIGLSDYLRPLYGVYAVRAKRVRDHFLAEGVANIGRRPTVDGAREWLEAHFFAFDGDIYGEEWEIALIDLIRPEQRFSGLDALKAAIAQDCATARDILAKTEVSAIRDKNTPSIIKDAIVMAGDRAWMNIKLTQEENNEVVRKATELKAMAFDSGRKYAARLAEEARAEGREREYAFWKWVESAQTPRE